MPKFCVDWAPWAERGIRRHGGATRIALAATMVPYLALLAALFGALSYLSLVKSPVPTATLNPDSLAVARQLDALAIEDPRLRVVGGATVVPKQGPSDNIAELVAPATDSLGLSETGADRSPHVRGHSPEAVSPVQAQSQQQSNSLPSRAASEGGETQLYQASDAVSTPSQGGVAWGEQKAVSTPFKIRERRDWEISLSGFDRVEDSKMTYSVPDSGVRLTARKADFGFGTNFPSNSSGVSNYLTSGPLGLSPADGIAQSQKIDGTLMNSKDFKLSTFAYHSEVGRNFEAFGKTKKEFKTAGSRKMKTGANMQMGAFGFGLAQSMTENTYGSADAAFNSEASASIDLPRLMQAAKVPGDLTLKLIPTVWMKASTRTSALGQEGDDINLGFGGTWSWDMGYASLGYWSSSLGYYGDVGGTWSGQGFDANVGAYYGVFALDVGVTYGQSEDALSSWRSASDMYNYSATVSYNGEKLPGISLTASMGNYDQSSISFGSEFSESYALSSTSDYVSISAGLDLTGLFLSNDGGNGQPSMKMLYRHSESGFNDSYSSTEDVNDIFALTVQGRF